MSSNHDRPTPPRSPKEELLGELESIKGLLEDEMDMELDIDIPILNDVVATEKDSEQSAHLLDLQSIFEDDDIEEPPANNASLTVTPEPEPSNNPIAPVLAAATNEPLAEEQKPDQTDTTFEGLENYSLDDLNLDDINLNDLNLDDLDCNIEVPDFKLSTAISNQLTSESTANNLGQSADVQPPAPTRQTEDLNDELATNTEEQEDLFPELTANTSDSSIETRTLSAIDLDLLIQEIVDEFIPTIEDALRQRLSGCAPEVIKQLANKHLKR